MTPALDVAPAAGNGAAMTYDKDTLREVGEALYGPSWQTPMADALGVTDRTVRYWAGGKDIPAGVWKDLAALCLSRKHQLEAWAQRLAPDQARPG